MIKAYALNERGEIELTVEDLQKLLEEAEAEGRRLAVQQSIIYQCPLQTPSTTGKREWTSPLYPSITCQATSTRAGDIKAEG